MAPFQAAVPAGGVADTPGARDDLWTSSRSGRGQRVAERRAAEQRELDRLEAERQEAERQEVARREAQQREAEQRAAEQRAAEQRAAEERAAEQRAAEERAARQRETERRQAQRRLEAERRAAAPVVARPAPSFADDDDRDAPWSTGPTSGRPSLSTPGRPAGPAAQGGAAYGDWTRPSRSGAETGPHERVDEPEEDYASQRFARLRAGAPTEETDVAERDAVARRRPLDDDRRPGDRDRHDRDRDDRDGAPAARGPLTDPGPATDPGAAAAPAGRAARRAERQAAEAARQKAARDAGRPAGGRGRRSPRRAVLGLVAVAVVALGVLGVYSFASPHTQQAASQAPATQTNAGNALGTVPGVSDLPPLSTVPAPTSAAPTTPVRVPVTVLNSTAINGLAASVAGALKGGGWQTLPVGEYKNTDVAATTVYFTQGNEQQRQAALQLIQQFPKLHGPAVRFFNLPAGTGDGLVVVATGDWKP